jgi:PIN like domain
MRKALHEYFRPTNDEFEKLWKDALITFDASSLLNLYGYSAETKDDLVEAYQKFSDRIILPYQFALQYSRNRAKVINKQISNFQNAEKALQQLIKMHEAQQEQPYLSKQSTEAVDAILKELAAGRSKMERSMASDEDSDLLTKLFDGKVGTEPTAEELKSFQSEGKTRYAAQTPPGYEDIKDKGEPDCYGDFIAWTQIIATATKEKRDVILVTDDVKKDWWHYEGARLVGPLPALRKEFRATTGQSIWLYTTEGFLRAAREFAKIEVGDAALKEVSAAHDTQLQESLQRLLKVRFKTWENAAAETAKAGSGVEQRRKKAAIPKTRCNMAVRAFTDHPEALLSAIKRKIAEGTIKTWKLDEDGDLTLTSENFVNQAWMRPSVLSDRLLFNIVGKKNADMSNQLYAVYHARLVQMLLIYFDEMLSTATATALPTKGDQLAD